MTAATSGHDLLDLFAERARSVGADVRTTSQAEAPALVVELLLTCGARRIGLETAAETAFPQVGVAVAEAGFALVAAPASLEELAGIDAGISVASFAVAETGSLALASSAPGDRLVAMLAPVHVVLSRTSELLPSLDDAGARLRGWTVNGPERRYVSLVTGPSRTADIERVLTIGVQGPRALYAVLIHEDASLRSC